MERNAKIHFGSVIAALSSHTAIDASHMFPSVHRHCQYEKTGQYQICVHFQLPTVDVACLGFQLPVRGATTMTALDIEQ